jgi:glycosyltransferase involved in cell wall biosynthesis
MVRQLLQASEEWSDFRASHLNTSYARTREELGKGSFKKLLLMSGYLLKLGWRLACERTDVVVLTPSFFPGPFLKDSLFIRLASLFRCQVVIWVHMDPSRLTLDQRPSWFRRWAHSTLSRVDCLVACAPSLPGLWPKWLGARPKRGIANGIPDPAADHPLASPGSGEKRVITYLSAIDPEKGWRELFDVAQRLCDERDDVEFHFCGGIGARESEADVRHRFETSRHPSRILWRGPVYGAEKARQLSASDLFVFPSHSEQFSIAILEAMAFGLPVLATAVGATGDAITPEGGELISAQSPAQLETALVRLLASPATLQAMGAFNRQRFLEKFSATAFGRHWHQLFFEQTRGLAGQIQPTTSKIP